MNKQRISLSAVAVLAVLAAPRPVLANWPFNSFVNVPVCTAGSDQTFTISVADGNGGAFVTWGNDPRNATSSGGTGYDIYLQHVTSSGAVDASWPVDGAPICTLPGDQSATSIISDGAGGVFIGGFDLQSSVNYTFVQRVNAAGVPLWSGHGATLCAVQGVVGSPIMVSDGTGGAIVTWSDPRNGTNNFDAFAQRVNSAGVPQWTPNGVPVCTENTSQNPWDIVSDGAGGAIIVWPDWRSGDTDIYSQRLNAAGVPQWTANGFAVCTGAYSQSGPRAASDGAGGAIFAWSDSRIPSDADIYAQRVNAAGVSKWTPGGVKICGAAGHQFGETIVSDGAGGAIVAWQDLRVFPNPVFAQRVSATGAPVWAANGVCPAPSSALQNAPVAVTDGAGGAIITWANQTAGSFDIHAQRVLASGVVPFAWPANGRQVCTAVNQQLSPAICTEGNGKAIVAWEDFRNGSDWNIYAQLVAPAGFLGVPNPVIRPIGDLLWDQGGFVKVSWDASYLDTVEPYVVDHYWVLRSAPSSFVTSALAERRVLTPEQFGAASDALRASSGIRVGEVADADRAGVVEPIPDALVVTRNAATDYYWEPLARVDALHAIAGYSYVAPTTCDSTAAANPLTAFMVIAYDATGGIFLPSDPDSGYSVDNLSPATPGGLAGNVTAGTTHLHWIPNEDPDLANYRVYRGDAATFIPTAASLVGSPPDTGFADPGTPGGFYKLSAVDVHGNESGFALLTPSGTLDVLTEPAPVLALARPAPNPARGASNIEFALPHETHVSLTVHDVAGRAVRRIFDGVLPAGEHTQRWDLRDASGSSVRAGLYFIRLEADGRGLSQRLVVSGE